MDQKINKLINTFLDHLEVQPPSDWKPHEVRFVADLYKTNKVQKSEQVVSATLLTEVKTEDLWAALQQSLGSDEQRT